MTLLEFISDMAKRGELAATVGYSPDYLWQVATDRRKASHKLARAIEEATHGSVTRYTLRPDIFGTQSPDDQQEAA